MRVEVFARSGGLEAKLAIKDFDANAWKESFGDRTRLARHLRDQGLASEMIDEAVLDSICGMLAEAGADWTAVDYTLKEAQSLNVSCGVPPVDEQAEGLMFHKTYLADAAEIDALKARIAGQGFEAVKAAGADYAVEAGQTILSFLSISPGKPGTDVYGKPIPFRGYEGALPSAGRGIRKVDNKWEAAEGGFLVLEGDALMVLGPGSGRNASITVSPDRLKARLRVHAEVMDDAEFQQALDGISALLAEAGLPKPPSMDRIAKELGAGKREVVILEGTPPVPGKDGSLKLLVDPEPELPDPEAVAKLDFRNFSFFRAISKGQALAEVIPPDPGLPGRDVFGEAIPARPGRPFQVRLGANTRYDEAKPALIVAAVDGRISLEDGVPAVVDTLRVNDISFKTGNVSFPGSVEVDGNVLDSFAIDARGDVGIGGVVENAQVVSEGSIVIKGGVVGGGKGLIKSKLSSVTIGYIRNQRIESHSNIVVYNEVFNGQLLARRSILMKSSAHSVIGGQLTAFEGIEIHNSGNEAGAKTILEVGKDFEVEASLGRKRDQLKVVRGDQEFLADRLGQLELIVKWEGGRKPENRLLAQRVKGVLAFLDKVKQVLAAEIEGLEGKLLNKGEAHILVRGTAFPGTVLKYQGRVIPITEPVKNKRWVFKP